MKSEPFGPSDVSNHTSRRIKRGWRRGGTEKNNKRVLDGSYIYISCNLFIFIYSTEQIIWEINIGLRETHFSFVWTSLKIREEHYHTPYAMLLSYYKWADAIDFFTIATTALPLLAEWRLDVVIWHQYELQVVMVTRLWHNWYQNTAYSVCHALPIFQCIYILKFFQQNLQILSNKWLFSSHLIPYYIYLQKGIRFVYYYEDFAINELQ